MNVQKTTVEFQKKTIIENKIGYLTIKKKKLQIRCCRWHFGGYLLVGPQWQNLVLIVELEDFYKGVDL